MKRVIREEETWEIGSDVVRTDDEALELLGHSRGGWNPPTLQCSRLLQVAQPGVVRLRVQRTYLKVGTSRYLPSHGAPDCQCVERN